MTNEQVVSVPDMLRVTGENTAEFMKQVADHIEKLKVLSSNLKVVLKNLKIQQNENRT